MSEMRKEHAKDLRRAHFHLGFDQGKDKHNLSLDSLNPQKKYIYFLNYFNFHFFFFIRI